jgi:hypothetical protein
VNRVTSGRRAEERLAIRREYTSADHCTAESAGSEPRQRDSGRKGILLRDESCSKDDVVASRHRTGSGQVGEGHSVEYNFCSRRIREEPVLEGKLAIGERNINRSVNATEHAPLGGIRESAQRARPR